MMNGFFRIPNSTLEGRVAGILVLVGLVTLSLPAPAQNEAYGFKVPDIDEDGVLKSMFVGEKARMFPGKPMEIMGLTVEFYAEDGKTVELKITSPHCFYHSDKGIATSEDRVAMVGDGITVTGKGYKFLKNERRMEIHNQVKMVLRDVNLKPENAPDGDGADG